MNPDPSFRAGANATPGKKSFSRYLPTIVRILMGLPLLVFGLNLFLNFMPPPKDPMPEGAAAFAGALANTGYMMKLIGLTQLVVGLCLVTNRFVPFALALFAPFIVNSVLFHLFLEPSPAGRIMSCVFLALELYLVWAYRHAYRSMLAARVTPA